MLRRPEALNTVKAEPAGDIHSRETRQRRGGMDNGVGDFIASVCLGYHCLALHLTALALPALIIHKVLGFVNERGKFFYYGIVHLATDCGRSTVYGKRASLLPPERVEALSFGKLLFGDYNEVILRSSQEEIRDTLLNGANYSDFDVKRVSLQTFSYAIRFFPSACCEAPSGL